ncbi:Vta1 like [Carpediemonas membranifera]|uniref:Vta1 like n=1 Tax=Carpediemonas membranifera TaxID=201153 RepID=A0A8J6ASR0_9EUKA|nr:Vta1 like [Carpediemonas membranifera]QNO39415.1 vesicle trafficking 1 [Carpediemonas membranifera]|eukprot:KAG9393556.1 Vta1 like [Carpediemonas membranifera]
MEQIPQALQSLRYILERHYELKSINPVVSYALLVHALDRAMVMRKQGQATDPASTAFLSKMMDLMEAMDEHAIARADQAKKLESFAVSVFINADKADKTGDVSKATAAKFRAAAAFLEALTSFKDSVDTDYSDKTRYAKFRATAIAKQVADDRTRADIAAMEAGQPVDVSDELAQLEAELANEARAQHPIPTEPAPKPAPVATPSPARPAVSPVKSPKPVTLDADTIKELHRHIKIVNSAIEWKDVVGIRAHLEEALALLPQ